MYVKNWSSRHAIARIFAAMALVITLTSTASAQPGPGGGGGPGGPPPMRMQGMMGGNALSPIVSTIADLNLRPDFNLSLEQKTQIAKIRDEFKKSVDAWREENADEIRQIQEITAQLREAGPDGDPEAWRDVMEQNMALMQTAPTGESEAESVRAVLTDEQKKALETRLDEIAAEMEQMRQQMGGPGNRGPGGEGSGGRGQGRPNGGQGRSGGPGGV